MCVDFDADTEVGMEEESVPEFREPIARAKEKVDVAERKVVWQGAEEAVANSGLPPALGILDRPALTISLPNLDFDTGARRAWCVQGGVVETAGEAGGDSAAGGSSMDTPTPASRLSAPTAVDPPMVQDEVEVVGSVARVVVADAKLDAVLAASGGARQAVAKDGTCQFAAVAAQACTWSAWCQEVSSICTFLCKDGLDEQSRCLGKGEIPEAKNKWLTGKQRGRENGAITPLVGTLNKMSQQIQVLISQLRAHHCYDNDALLSLSKLRKRTSQTFSLVLPPFVDEEVLKYLAERCCVRKDEEKL